MKKLLLIISTCVLLFSTFAYGKTIDKKVFRTVNPVTGTTMLTNASGDILLKSIDEANEYIGIVEDIFTEEQTFLFKQFSGETSVKVTVDFSDGSYSYLDPSSRMVFYDLEGNEIGAEFFGVQSYKSCGDKIICGYDNKITYYDVNTKEIIEDNVYKAFTRCGDVILVYSYDDTDVKGIKVLNKNLETIKEYPDYFYFYSVTIDGKTYNRIRRKISDGKYVYNIIDDNGDKLFDEDVESEIGYDESPILDVVYGNTYVKYNIASKSYITTPSIITTEEKAKLIATPTIDDTEEKDENLDKLKSMIDENLNPVAEKLTYEDKVLYEVWYNGETFTKTEEIDGKMVDYETYNQKYNFYDKDLNLLLEGKENVIAWLSNYGFIIIDNKIYDFDMNVIYETDDVYNYNEEQINGNVYFVNSHTKDYKKNTNMTVFDRNFKPIYTNIYDFAYMRVNKIIFMTDAESTKIYDENFAVIKDLGIKAETTYNYTGNHYVLKNVNTNRYFLVDDTGKIIVENLKNVGMMDDDYFVYQKGFKYGVMDYEGNIINSYSIFDTIKEDVRLSDYDSFDIIEDDEQ